MTSKERKSLKALSRFDRRYFRIVAFFSFFLFSMQFSFVNLAKKNSEGDIEGQMGLM